MSLIRSKCLSLTQSKTNWLGAKISNFSFFSRAWRGNDPGIKPLGIHLYFELFQALFAKFVRCIALDTVTDCFKYYILDRVYAGFCKPYPQARTVRQIFNYVDFNGRFILISPPLTG